MRKLMTLPIILILTIHLHGQAINVSEKLTLTQLTERTYIHKCENSNGIIFIDGEGSLIVSTPDSDIETQNLIDWLRNEKKSKIVGCVIDRWHPDAMEGLDIIHINVNGEKLRSEVSYKNLIVIKENDSVGLRVIVKEFKKKNDYML